MCTKPLILICCLLIASDALAVRGDGSRIQNFRNNHPNYYNSTDGVIIQRSYGYNPYYNPYINPYMDNSSFNPGSASQYRDRKGNLIYYNTDYYGNTVYFKYGDDGKIVPVDPLQHPP